MNRKALFRSWLAVTTIVFVANTNPARADETAVRTTEHSYEFDERGDAKLEISFQYGAAQWLQWKEQYGDHPDILLRNLRYELAAGVVDDFALERDDVRRRAVAKIKARSLARYHGDGKFTIEVPKTMKLVTGSGRDWVFTGSAMGSGEIVNQTTRAKLPEKAQNAHLTSGGDVDQLVYTLQVTAPRPKGWLELGIVLIIAGVALGFIANRSGKTTALSPPSVPPNLPPTPPPALPSR